ncbi:MAG TPA: 4-hydroxythreonine-4-phosphate dehydrogenase PdxA, partial [bacterium]|nr:4-hydroxythreonine-4-phosphate dehydrogenase PdxA [bacterium]
PDWPAISALTSRPVAPCIVDCPHPAADRLPYGAVSRAGGALSAAILTATAAALQPRFVDGVVTLPLSKAALRAAGSPYHGHTEFFRDAAGAADAVMAFHAPGFMVALATIHEPLARVPQLLTADHLTRVLRLAHTALRTDFGLAAPRLGVLGLNPHAGEDGVLGDEELRIISPVLDRLRADGLLLDGPLVPDVAFRHRDRYDLLVALYHDQGLIPFKLLAFDRGVNVTLGLPFVRTSVDHGTAYDIAGRGVAATTSFLAAWQLAAAIAARHARH